MDAISTKDHFLKDQYIVFQKSDRSIPFRLFLLGEDHTSEKCREINSRTISLIDPEFIFLEGIASMKEIEDDASISFIKNRFHLDPEKKIRFMGWDASREILDCIGTPGHEVPWLKEKLNEFDTYAKTVKNTIEEVCPGYLGASEEVQSSLLKALPNEKAEWLLNAIKFMDVELPGYRNEVESQLANVASKESYRRVYPFRTRAEAATVRKIMDLQEKGIIKGNVVILTGASHLKTREHNKGIKEYSLEPLYQALEQHPAAIVMIPQLVIDESYPEAETASNSHII